MLLSIGIGAGNLQPEEKDIGRTIDRTYKISFRIDQLPIRGFQTMSAIVLLSVLPYQLMVYYNSKNDESNPKSIKYMLGTWREAKVQDKVKDLIMTMPHLYYAQYYLNKKFDRFIDRNDR
jgi:hypothetical protein